MTTRRQFFKNTLLASIAGAALPSFGKEKAVLQEECFPVTLDYYGIGPFYKEGAPMLKDAILTPSSAGGTPIIISGQVSTLDCAKVIPETIIDIWHAGNTGRYDSNGFQFRGKILSNEQGFYTFETILPGKYLNGSSYRPRHIHLKITPPGFPTIITQIYFAGDTDIAADAAASIKSGRYDASHRIIALKTNTDGKLEGTWNIAINGEGKVLALDNVHADKGIIYAASPNPFQHHITINYGVFVPAKVSVSIFNINGKLVAELTEDHLTPEKYEAVWNPDSNVLPGMYWAVLKINDLQVHYLKIAKQ